MAVSCLCPGDLRHRVTIEEMSYTKDEGGGLVPTWTTVATVWAKVEQTSAGERFVRHQIDQQAAWKVSIRYRAGITAKQRVRWGDRVLEIKSAEDLDLRKRFWVLACDDANGAT